MAMYQDNDKDKNNDQNKIESSIQQRKLPLVSEKKSQYLYLQNLFMMKIFFINYVVSEILVIFSF